MIKAVVCSLAFGAVVTLAWPVAAETPEECVLKLPLSADQVRVLESGLMKAKAEVKKAIGTVPNKCPGNINSYQDGDDYLTRLTPEQVQQIRKAFPNATTVPESVTFKVAELWSRNVSDSAFICIVVVGSKIVAKGEVK